jgi:hypothetical protein
MGTKTEALAAQFEGKARDAMATLEGLSEADWKKVTEAEKWPVGVTAHHLAGALEAVSGLVMALANGQPPGGLSVDMLNELNAQHAREFAHCTKAETIELHRRGTATAAAAIRSLHDEQLERSGVVLTGLPPMSAEQLIQRGLLDHVDEHVGSIRRTIE